MYLFSFKYCNKKMAGKDPTNPLPHLPLSEFLLSVVFRLVSWRCLFSDKIKKLLIITRR